MGKRNLLVGSLLIVGASLVAIGCVQPTPTSKSENLVEEQKPASIFRVSLPETAAANSDVEITSWLLLKPGSAGRLPKIKDVRAEVNESSKTITISGTVNTFEFPPGHGAPTSVASPSAATQSISTRFTSPGVYTVLINEQNFISEIPQTYGPSGELQTNPQPQATTSITVE